MCIRDSSIKSRIKADFFKDVPIILDERCEGQSITEEGKVVIGARAGPEICWTNLGHEMAHLVEIDRPRITKRGWGLRYGKYWEFFGRSGYEPQTDQQVRREERVWAFQLNFLHHYGIEMSVKEMVSTAQWLPAFCYVKTYEPKDKTKMEDRDEERFKIIADRVLKNMETFTMEMFCYEWHDRMKYLSITDLRSKEN